MNTWDLIKRQLATKLSADSYENWVGKTEFSHIQDNCLVVLVPSEDTRAWMESEYSNLVNTILRSLAVGLSSVVYELESKNIDVADGTAREEVFSAPQTQLNPKYTFDNF